ncbi:TauD/TfdA dioxygenase family protein [Ottowia thiooxydans]|uniref:TauD/TfdA dioxygenase family protein n=1 Tax=Ottowia thiooxydans TaxID=219182 RepID=UPI0012EB43D2|nr:TauD/TfdA family dioxygenase [Ottowia thiooxydans]
MNALEVTPISETFGTRVRGQQLQNLRAHPKDVETIQHLLVHRGVVVLSDVNIDADQFVDLGQLFGEVRPARIKDKSLSPPASEYVFVGRRTSDNIPSKLTRADVAHIWHADYSTAGPIPKLAAQYTVNVNDGGGWLSFADMRKAYATLPPATQAQLRGLGAVHYEHPVGVDVEPPGQAAALSWEERHKGAIHPLVMISESGIPQLCLPARPDSPVQGMDEKQSAAFLELLWSHALSNGEPWDIEPKTGDIVIWNNHAIAHKRSEWPLDKERLVWFITTH